MKLKMKLICCVLAFSMVATISVPAFAAETTVPTVNLLPKETATENSPTTVPTVPAAGVASFAPGSQALPKVSEAVKEISEPAEPEDPIPAETADASIVEIPATEETVPEEPEREILTCDVPLYWQTDYPDDLFGYGTIATDGCSVTSLAMIASYMTGHEYLPDELAKFVGLAKGTYIEKMEFGMKMLRLPYEKATNWHDVLGALKEGKKAIILVNYKSVFTTTQHFLVLGGMTEDGRIIVNDPYEPNYDLWALKNGFANGFKDGDVCCGYSSGWIFDINDMPEEPFIYNHVEPPYGEPRYPDLVLTQEDKVLLAKVIWTEARGETIRGQQAVAEVVLNRLACGKYQYSVKSIVYADEQFTGIKFMEEATPSQIQYVAIERALYGPYVLPEDVLYYAVFKMNDNVWGKIGGHYFCYDYDKK